MGIFLLLPFALNWLAAAAGLYPDWRMRQCLFLAIFALAGVSICLARVAGRRIVVAAAAALGVVVLCHAFGTLQDRDELPLAEQRHEHMDQMLAFIRSNVRSNDEILTDQATSFQLRHYLCNQKPVVIEVSHDGFESFHCEGIHVVLPGRMMVL